MRLPFIAFGLASLAPVLSTMLEKRQSTLNELSGSCRKVIFIFARASTEPGNMGMSMGPTVCRGLKSKLGANNVACQGVGGAYKAGLAENVYPKGTTDAAIRVAKDHFTSAVRKCPQAKIVSGGYSQGSALMMNAVKESSKDIQAKILGVVLFGYTKNKQTNSGIPGFPKNRVAVYCSKSDGVCKGTLSVTGGHFSYMGDGSGAKAIAFLVSQINAGGGASSGDGDEGPSLGGGGGGKRGGKRGGGKLGGGKLGGKLGGKVGGKSRGGKMGGKGLGKLGGKGAKSGGEDVGGGDMGGMDMGSEEAAAE